MATSNKPNLKALIASRIPAIFWGAPGIGKTAWINAEVKDLGLHMETVISSVREPADMSGLPVITENGVTFSIPMWAQNINKTGGVVFFDEMTTAAPAVQASLLRVIHEGVVGETKLRDDVYFMAAANPAEYAANGYELAGPLANRFIHLNFREDPADFCANFPTYWGKVPELKGIKDTVWGEKRGLVAAYLSARPTSLLAFPEAESNRGKAWPSPRSWDAASRVLAACNSLEEAIPLVVGAVGESQGIEFFSWLKNMDLPKPKDVLDNVDSFKVPERSDKTYAIISGIVAFVKENFEKKYWDATWKVIGKVCESNQPDVAAVWALNLSKDMKPEWGFPKEFIKFAPLFAGIKS